VRLRLAAWLALVVLSAQAAAQDGEPVAWAVQTVALRDYREAQAAAAELRVRDFDAYTEFAMQDGLQFVRVRVGCFTSRAAAEAMADALRERVTNEAAVVEYTPGAPARACATSTVGFMKPSEWEPVREPGAIPAFNVKVSGLGARVMHDGSRWRVEQGYGPIPLRGELPTAEFTEAVRGGVRFVAEIVEGHSYVICPGRLLAQVGEVAIVEQGELLVACDFRSEAP